MAETKNTKAFYNTEIPSDWEVKHFEDVADIDRDSLNGSTPKDYEFDYISLSDVDSDDFKIETTRQVFASAPSRARRIVKKGDILMSTVRPNLQGFSLIRNEVKDLIASTGFAVITAKKCSNEYLFQYLFSSGIERQFYQLLVGSNYPAINSSDVKKLKIPLPTPPEQRAIAQVLSTADAAIHTTEKLIAQKELRKKWLMQQLLTGKKRLKGFEGEWKKLGAGEIFKSITKKGFADEELLSATQDRGMIPRTMLEGRVTMPTTGTEGFKLVEIGDFVISLRSFQGGLEYSYYRGLVSPAYTVLKPKKPINEEFYKQYFKSYEFIGRLATAVIGIRDGKQISYDDFCIVKIPYPSIEEQTAIAQVLQAAGKEISLLKTKAEKLRELKKVLMQVLLTGKKRLKSQE
ncbi:MAG: restriction endonuclease subunit S [Lentimicrobium sp.]